MNKTRIWTDNVTGRVFYWTTNKGRDMYVPVTDLNPEAWEEFIKEWENQ